MWNRSDRYSHHQGLFQRVGSSYQVARLLELQLHHQSFQWIFRVDFLIFILVSKGIWQSLLLSWNTVFTWLIFFLNLPLLSFLRCWQPHLHLAGCSSTSQPLSVGMPCSSDLLPFLCFLSLGDLAWLFQMTSVPIIPKAIFKMPTDKWELKHHNPKPIDVAKAALRGKFIAIQSYRRIQEKSQVNHLTKHKAK